jgi:hypothetical protein
MSTREPETDGLAAEAAQDPPTEGEKLYASGGGNCKCQGAYCEFCCSLTEVEINIYSQDGLEALRQHWADVIVLRNRQRNE